MWTEHGNFGPNRRRGRSSALACAVVLLGALLAAWVQGAAAQNAIAFHDRNSNQYNDNCRSCHAAVLTEAPVVANAPVTNPNLRQQPRTRTVHGTMLARAGVKPGESGDDMQCQFCHRSINVVEGPPMPEDPLKGAIRKHVDPAVCTLCHGPKTGGQPNSPGPQFYQVGLLQLIPPTDPQAGQRLYGLFCAGCHRPLANSEVRGESAGEIQGKINENEGGMGPLRVLTPAQIQAIASALGSGASVAAAAAPASTAASSSTATPTNTVTTSRIPTRPSRSSTRRSREDD